MKSLFDFIQIVSVLGKLLQLFIVSDNCVLSSVNDKWYNVDTLSSCICTVDMYYVHKVQQSYRDVAKHVKINIVKKSYKNLEYLKCWNSCWQKQKSLDQILVKNSILQYYHLFI